MSVAATPTRTGTFPNGATATATADRWLRAEAQATTVVRQPKRTISNFRHAIPDSVDSY